MQHVTPIISLIIPAYNEEKYIGACLGHVIKNSGGLLAEIIVVDNASTDRTAEIAQSFPGVRVVREDRKGLTRARQCGYEQSMGDILAYIDADTQMPARWTQTLVNEFSKDEKLACLSGPYIYYDIPKFQQWVVKWIFWYLIAIPAALFTGYLTIGGNFVIRRSVLGQMNGFDTTISFYGEDTDVGRRAHAFGKTKFKMSFFMFTSGRRLQGQGVLKMFWIYGINYLSEVFLRRPITEEYIDIR